MNVLTRYIVGDILKASSIAAILLLTLFDLFTFSDELDDIGRGEYGLLEVCYFVTFTSPTILYELMPASALIGSLFALGGMANSQELVAMRAAGLSVFGIIRAVLVAGCCWIAVAVLVGEFIAPIAESKAQVMRATAQQNPFFRNLKYGIWLREGTRFINIRLLEDNGDLADISIYETDAQRHLLRSIHAQKAVYLGKQQWRLQDIQESSVSTTQMHAKSQTEQIWNSSIAPDLLKIVVVNPDNLSLYDLAMYVEFLKDNQQKSQLYEMSFWGRVVTPLVIFAMLLVSAPFVIGVKRGISAATRILIGVVIGMGFNVIDMTISHIGLIYSLNPPLIAFMPSLLVLSAAVYAIRKRG
ncbi:MAG: LPS export ABC transporter permease LptG [Methylovulum sp.]|uniref:LPS export ABC transporter permease LptG n=1 Tax=Methylovulum sp. TaxID=1916980 RepID=UPI002632A64E|nr:LPS export ABC transporter permease LptG [Methylovulum sp.]MDD2724100.1 LPS export ABC transporter permease LptG [Methylovulum sp.]MDD5124726.1 LPS export ABC transporter permease LptG [Methylovulum sp.]